MRLYLHITLILLLGALALPGWAQAALATDTAPATRPMRFAIMADVTGAERRGVFDSAIDKLNLLQPDFVLSVGDLIRGYTTDTASLTRQFTAVDAKLARLQMPFYRLVGNHDVTNTVAQAVYQQRYGRLYSAMVRDNILFLLLNSEDPPRAEKGSNIGDEQLAFIQQTLAAHPDVRWTFVLLHKPMWRDARTNWPKVEEALGERPYTVFAGHFHQYLKTVRNGHEYYMLATTGAGSQLRGLSQGEFDHLVWVTMTDNGPAIVNLLLDGIVPNDVRTEDTAPVPAAPGE